MVLGDRGGPDREIGRQPGPQILRQIGHVVEALGPPLEQPAADLPRAICRQRALGEPGGESFRIWFEDGNQGAAGKRETENQCVSSLCLTRAAFPSPAIGMFNRQTPRTPRGRGSASRMKTLRPAWRPLAICGRFKPLSWLANLAELRRQFAARHGLLELLDVVVKNVAQEFHGPVVFQRADRYDRPAMFVSFPHLDRRSHRGFRHEGQHHVHLAAEAVVMPEDLAPLPLVVVERIGVISQRIVNLGSRKMCGQQLASAARGSPGCAERFRDASLA